MSLEKIGKRISLQTVERMSLYRKVLEDLHRNGVANVYSHQLAEMVHVESGTAEKGPRLLRLLRQHLQGISRIPDDPHHQPTLRDGHTPERRPDRRWETWGGRFCSTGGSRNAAFTSPWSSTSMPRRWAGSLRAGDVYHIRELETVLPDFGITMAILACGPQNLQNLVDRLGKGRGPVDSQLRPQAGPCS